MENACDGAIDRKRKRIADLDDQSISPPPLKRLAAGNTSMEQRPEQSLQLLPSPFKVNSIQGLPQSANKDAVSLADLLGDPLIRECWVFDYLFDVDWLMEWFDVDVRHLVQVKIVHGSWRKEDSNKVAIDEAASRHANVEVITAYMPEAYGTHHSKFIVTFRHDDEAQVVVHTANMIRRDWTNMSQGVWCSPRLPFAGSDEGDAQSPIGTGHRFKYDLMRYLKSYGQKRTGNLVERLKQYDFSSVRAAFVSSVPCRLSLSSDTRQEALYGWPYLRHVLRQRPSSSSGRRSTIVSQVSSVAYLGAEWINHFFQTLQVSSASTGTTADECQQRVMFPTTEEVRTSLDGYQGGASIHMRLQSHQAQQQLLFLKRYLVRWAGVDPENRIDDRLTTTGRASAAPHVKTYVRFSDRETRAIDWAMLTSANLSTQAWGSLPRNGEVRICSYEVGVLVWPSMLSDDASAVMVPTFQQDLPDHERIEKGSSDKLIGLRLPYSLPLKPYGAQDDPWIATAAHDKPDSHGIIARAWPPN